MASGTMTPVSTGLLEMLRVELNTTADDAQLSLDLVTAEAVLRERYSRTMTETTVVTEARNVYADAVRIWPPNLTTASAVTCDDATVDFTQVIASGGGVESLYLEPWCVGQYVSITGTWGSSAFTEAEKRAVVIQAATIYRRRQYGTENGFVGRLDAVCKEAADILNGQRPALY